MEVVAQKQQEVKKKRPYVKPTMRFESFELETPFATNCMADKDDMNDLIDLGYFTDEMNCLYADGLHENPKITREITRTSKDKICYHSNVIAAFMS